MSVVTDSLDMYTDVQIALHSVFTRRVLFCLSPGAVLACRYVAYKHHQLLFLDMLGGVYQLAVAASLTKRSLFEHPATWILLLMTLIKALPHMPLLLGYSQKHIRYACIAYATWSALDSWGLRGRSA
jgi:hypothetical protein